MGEISTVIIIGLPVHRVRGGMAMNGVTSDRVAPPTEMEAIVALRSGDMRGMETIASQYLSRAARLASSITRSRDAGQEIAHAALIKAARAIAGFDSARPFWPWFRRIVVNEALRAVLARERLVEGMELDVIVTTGAGRELADPAACAEGRELRRLLDQALAALDGRDRAVLVLHYFEDQSVEVISRLLGWPEGTVKARLCRARRRLRERIERGPRAILDGYAAGARQPHWPATSGTARG